MTATGPSRTDLEYEILFNPNKFVPAPSPQVKVKTTIVDGKPSYLMKDYATIRYFYLDELSNQIWTLTDGKRTVAQIIEGVQLQKPHARDRVILSTLLYFAENNLLMATLEQPPQKRFKVVSAFEADFAIVRKSNDFLQSLNRKVHWIFNKYLFWAVIAFIIVCTLLFAPEIISIYGNKANFEIMGSSVVGFFFYTFITLAPVIAIHEIAHGLTLAHYGGQPGEMGTGLFYFSPMFYVGTADAWGLSRRQRILVYLAGNISTLLIGSILFVLHLVVKIPEPGSLILTMTAFYCFTMSMFNFAPPFETDGYYVLTDAVNMPSLRQDSYGYLGSIFKRALGMHVKTKIPGLNKQKKHIFLGYAIMSVVWIFYSVYQTSIFLVFMAQDVISSLSKIFNAVLFSQALSASVVVIALLSTVYFGMQIMGYGLLLQRAVKKATAKPLQVEAIHNRNLAVFTYLPPQVPESLSMMLKSRIEKIARKLTSNFEMKQVGRSWITILRMGGTSLALVQIKEHLGRIESGFSRAYQSFILGNREALQESAGVYPEDKARLTALFDQVASESANAGNSGARAAVRTCMKKQNETFLYLLLSTFGTVWTIEVEPLEEFEVEKELVQSLFLEDLTLTDLYGDVENFKKSIIYGFDSLARLATEVDIDLMNCLKSPEKYQVISIFEPVRSRITFVGRTKQIEKNIDNLASLFIAQSWSGYLDDQLSRTCLALSVVSRSSLPSIKEIKEMSNGELAVLSKELVALTENQKLVAKCIEWCESHIGRNKQILQRLKTVLKPSKTFEIGLLDAMLHVNVENMENLPSRMVEFRKQWKTSYERIEKVREHVEKELVERKPSIEKKKRKVLRIYPFIIALSIVLLILNFETSLTTWWIIVPSIALLHGLYWFASYLIWKSFSKVTRYSSPAFSTSQMYILALTEAIYGYATTGDTLAPL